MGELEQPGSSDQPQAPDSAVAETHDHRGKPPAKPRRRRDWEKIEADYVRGIVEHGDVTWPTHEQLAEKWGVSRRQVVAHSAKGRWPERREQFRAETALAAMRRDFTRRLEEADRADRKALSVGHALLNTVAVWISQAHQAGTIDPRQADAAAGAAVKAQRLIRTALGIPTDLVQAAEEETQRRRDTAPPMDLDDVRALAREFIAAIVGPRELPPKEEEAHG